MRLSDPDLEWNSCQHANLYIRGLGVYYPDERGAFTVGGTDPGRLTGKLQGVGRYRKYRVVSPAKDREAVKCRDRMTPSRWYV